MNTTHCSRLFLSRSVSHSFLSRISLTASLVSAVCFVAVVIMAIMPSATVYAQGGTGNWYQFGYGNPVQFGRINPQYKSFRWQFLQAKNFDVYFYQDGDYVAQYAAVELEAALQDLQRMMNYVISDRIPVMVYISHADYRQSNSVSTLVPRGLGETVELPKNRMNVAFEGDWMEFRHQLRHRLVHAFITEMYFGGLLQSTVSSGFRIDLQDWVLEGLAEYFSAGGYDSQTDAAMRDFLSAGRIPNPSTINGSGQYRLGHAMFAYIAGKFGQAKVGEFMGRLRAVGSMETAFRAAFGAGQEAFWRIWQSEAFAAFKADINKYEKPETFARAVKPNVAEGFFANLLQGSSQAASTEPFMTSPAISPNGDQLAYIANTDDGLALFVTRLLPQTAQTNASSSTTSAQQQSSSNKQTGKATKEVSSPEVATETATRIMELGRKLDPEDCHSYSQLVSWKQDGTRLAVVAANAGSDALLVANLATGEKTTLTTPVHSITSVAWSPDGKMIAFVGVERSSTNLYTLDLATRKVRKLTDDVFTEADPVWSWDSQTLYFLSDRGKNLSKRAPKDWTEGTFGIWDNPVAPMDVYSLTLSTLVVERITGDAVYHKTSIAVAPDNTSLLIAMDKNGIGNVYQLNLLTNELAPKTNTMNPVARLSLTRGGTALAFTTQSAGGERLFVMPAPFARKPLKEPELTSYKKEIAERDELTERAVELLENRDAIASKQGKDSDTVRGYGTFDVDFSRQRMVYPDPEAATTGVAQQNSPYDRDTAVAGNLRAQPYKFVLSNDNISINPSWDTFARLRFALSTMFTDILGDHRFMFAANLLWDFRDIDLIASYAYLPEVIDYEFNAFYTGRLFAIPQPGFLQTSRLAVWGVNSRAILPLTAHSRVEGQLRWVNTTLEALDDVRIPVENRMMFVPELRYIFDNTDAGVFAPKRGTRAYAAFDGSPGLGIATRSATFGRFVADYRQYIPVGDLFTVAARISGGTSFGGDSQQFYLSAMDNVILGPSISLPLRNAQDLAFSMPIAPVRGFNIGPSETSQDALSRVNNNFVLANLEVRVPLIRNSSGLLGGVLQYLQANAFVDAGSLWSRERGIRAQLPIVTVDRLGNLTTPAGGDYLLSAGLGVRTFLLGIPVKFDIAWVNVQQIDSQGSAQNTWLTPRYVLSLGGEF